jgi:ADP-ribose pyrophosphatase
MEETLYQGTWLKLAVKSVDKRGEMLRYEYLGGEEAATVCVLGITKQTDQVLLIANFRYPVNQFVIELPAGFVDEGEDTVHAALRELREETGYTAGAEDVVCISPGVFPVPRLTHDSTAVVTVRVDLNLLANQSPEQDLDNVENIRQVMLPRATLLSSLLAYADQEGYGIDARLYAFAQGLGLSSL